ncbi:unnamed protein product [Effrenium voratum]|uniref:DNA polymerase kappa n=1 Tax=Effrenium voratum TaxID=2562239 RepID=A0AA36IYB3_9DINO|nr:unnamed protein product [Effrenium voratum]CAJ1446698.1 unnamed protein product [Effrenium voratum]
MENESGGKSHLFHFTGVSANKAGMGADRKLVADFVYQKSKNSQYTAHQLDLDAKQRQRSQQTAQELQDAEARMTEVEKAQERRKAEAEIQEVEKHRDLTRTYCVVDMDMFYAAVEIRDAPHLATKPVAIGGLGMICTANYVARQYGVRAAMPGFIAVDMVRNPTLVGSKMPPDELVFISPNFAKYSKVAMETREIFRDYDPNFKAYSLDEAYLDLTDQLQGRDPEEVVQEMRGRVKAATGLTCSAGIGPNRMIAKIASDERKPDGQTRILPTREAVLSYMDALPVRKIPGCGKVLEQQIACILQVQSCREVREINSLWRLRRAFQSSRPKTYSFLLRACLGLSGDEVAEDGEEVGAVGRKSLSCERTFRQESCPEELRVKLRDLCRQVSEDMAAAVPPLAARCVALKAKSTNFEVRNKQLNVPRPVGFSHTFGEKAGDAEAQVAQVAQELYKLLEPILEEQLPCSLRLMGVRVSGFRDQRQQLSKGQRQLQSFFGKKPAADPEDEAQVIELSGSEDDLLPTNSAEGGFSFPHAEMGRLKRVVEDSTKSTKRIRTKSEGVCCPVCGKRVPETIADQHVNAHYGE